MKFTLNEDNRADETYFFEVVGSDEDGWLVDVANVYDVIKLEIENLLLPNYRLLVVMFRLRPGLFLKHVYAMIQLTLDIAFNMILNRIELIIYDDQGGICEIAENVNDETFVLDLILINAWYKLLLTCFSDVILRVVCVRVLYLF